MYKKSVRKRIRARPASWPSTYHQMMVIVTLYPLLWTSWFFVTGPSVVDGQRLFSMESMRSRQPYRLPSSFQSVDSFNETITVFNLTTTVSPIEETATKVSVETIDTLLEALDGAASAIDGQHFSTGILSHSVVGTFLQDSTCLSVHSFLGTRLHTSLVVGVQTCRATFRVVGEHCCSTTVLHFG